MVISAFLACTGRPPTLAGRRVCSWLLRRAGRAWSSASRSRSSVLFLRYRDLNQVWDVVTQAGFFLAPIIYPLGIIPERFHSISICGRRRRSSSSRAPCWSAERCRPLTAHAYLALDAAIILLPASSSSAARAPRRGVRLMAAALIAVDRRAQGVPHPERAPRHRARAPLRSAAAAAVRTAAGARRGQLRAAAGRDAGDHGPQRLGQEHAAEDPLRDLPAGSRAGRRAAPGHADPRAGRGLEPRARRRRQRLPDRRA